MTPSKFDQRLADLEAKTRPADPRPDEAATLQMLHFLATDPVAGRLHTAALVETANLTCTHIKHGWCRRCIESTPTVGAAWQAVGLRMRELESLHNPHTEEVT